MPDAAITDAAILVADHAANYVEDRPDGGSRTVIIPHHYSLDGARWAEVADAAGMRFVSPRSTVTEIVSQISNADLVITEAMHGAILADTLRVPWIPVQCSPDFDSFKWRDWAMSMDLTFSPIKVAPTSAQKALSYWRKSKAAHHYVPFPDSLDVSAPGMRDLLTDHLQSRYRSWGGSSGQAGDRARLKEALALFDGFFVSRVSRTLKDIARTPPFLSTDAMFKTRLHQMRGAVDRFVEDAISRQI
ncbi:MAG: polysaccharide pyruvyl transferase family protein [bacterium]|nr:polysaccharide pyruvyl transferase family protein [bacterium]